VSGCSARGERGGQLAHRRDAVKWGQLLTASLRVQLRPPSLGHLGAGDDRPRSARSSGTTDIANHRSAARRAPNNPRESQPCPARTAAMPATASSVRRSRGGGLPPHVEIVVAHSDPGRRGAGRFAAVARPDALTSMIRRPGPGRPRSCSVTRGWPTHTSLARSARAARESARGLVKLHDDRRQTQNRTISMARRSAAPARPRPAAGPRTVLVRARSPRWR